MESKWRHYPSARAELKAETDPKKKHCFTMDMMEKLLTFDEKPYAYSILQLPAAYATCLEATRTVFKKHDYARIMPLVREVFGDTIDLRRTPLVTEDKKAPARSRRRRRPEDAEYKGRTLSRKPWRAVRSVAAAMYRDSFSSNSASAADKGDNVLEVDDVLLEALHLSLGSFWYLWLLVPVPMERLSHGGGVLG